MALGETKTASAYGITEGKVLVNGVAYSIKQGKTLVNGVAYDIGGNGSIPVTITGTGNSTYSYCVINNITYTTATSGIEVLADDVIQLHIAANTASDTGATITIDGEVVVASAGRNGVTYSWSVPSRTKSISIVLYHGKVVRIEHGTITVTTE